MALADSWAEADDFSSGPSKFALQRTRHRRRRMKMLLKKFFQNVHGLSQNKDNRGVIAERGNLLIR